MPTTRSKSKYRPEIDGLRAIAVIAVIVNHINKNLLPSGYLGVDIFFVISGYVITSSLADRPSTTFADFLSGFYARRIKRIIPALVLLVLVTSPLISLFNPSPHIHLTTGITALFGLSNLYLFKQATDYFALSTEFNPFTHTWSLGVEEQFYLVFPFIFWLSGFASHTERARASRTLLVWIGGLSILSLVAFIALYSSNQPAAYFLMPTRFWEMAVGCIAFLCIERWQGVYQRSKCLPAVLILAAMVGVMYMSTTFAVAATLLIVCLTVVLITSIQVGTLGYQLLTYNHLVSIGLISYSLYLWHWVVLCLSRWTIGVYWWTAPFQIILMFFIAFCSYRWIETPFRTLNLRRSLLMLFGASSLFLTSSLVFIFQKYLASRILLRSSNPIVLSTWWQDKNGTYIEKCHLFGAYARRFLSECLGLSRKKSPVAFLVGDSHARNYLTAAKNAFPRHTVAYLTIGSGCAYLPMTMISDSLESLVKCRQYVSEVTEFLRLNARSGDVVLVGQSLMETSLLKRATAPYFANIQSLAQKLEDKHVPVVLFDGVFPPGAMPAVCSKEVWRPFPDASNCQVPKRIVDSSYHKFDLMASSLMRRSNNVFYIPLRQGLCSGESCGQYMKSGTPIWHDNGHITETASGELATLLSAQLESTGFNKYLKNYSPLFSRKEAASPTRSSSDHSGT